MPSRRAVFLDKDGTLVDDVPYNVDPAKIRLTAGAAEAARSLRAAGFQLIVITNQSGVARGLFPVSALVPVRDRIEQLMRDAGAPIAGFYFCPHLPRGSVVEYAIDCDCRKPAPGLILQAAADHVIDLPGSWVVGDKLDDVEAGRRAGCQTVLIGRGDENHQSQITMFASDLAAAARMILSAPAEDVNGDH
jgi:D-glycero-D-manno-heptose 1,7-bisphosphate phosphatase